MMFSTSFVVVTDVKAEQPDSSKIYDNDPHIAIDSSEGIGYLSPRLYEYMTNMTYFSEIDFTVECEQTIFLQHEYQGSESFLQDIQTVIIVDEIALPDCSHLFDGLENLEEIIGLENLDLSSSPKLECMFSNCPKLKTVDFTSLDTSKCGDFSYMFSESNFESLNLSSLDTSSGYEFGRMFSDCPNLKSLDLSSFDTRNASHMESMFQSCPKLEFLDISSFDLSNNPYTEDFFRGTEPKVIRAPKTVPEPGWNDLNVVKFYLPQKSSEFPYYYDQDLNNYTYIAPANNNSVTYYNEEEIKSNVVLYAECSLQIINELEDTINPDVDELIACWNALPNYDYSIWISEADYAYVLTILEKCKADTINETVSEFLTFYDRIYTTYCHVLTNCGGDFLNRFPNALNPDGLIHIGMDTTNNIGYISSIDSYEILKSDLRAKVNLFNTSIENSIFSFLNSSEYENISKIVIQDEVTIPNCANLFKGLENVVLIEGMNNLNTELSVSCASMFEDCSSLESIDLSCLDTDDISKADGMFKNCDSLALIDSLEFSSKSLESISEMFLGCQRLTLLDLSNFDLTNVTNAINCFEKTSFLYMNTPKAMPTSSSCELELYFPIGNPNFTYYDLTFQTLDKLPKINSSSVIISTIGKGILDNICDGFINDCEYYCELDGSTSQQSLIKLWKNQSEEFVDHVIGTPNECLMEFFKQDNSSSTDALLKSFSEKYDYIYGKYHTILDSYGGDFASRSLLIDFVKNNPSSLLLSNSKDQNSIILVTISIFTIGGFSLFYLNRKKKINN